MMTYLLYRICHHTSDCCKHIKIKKITQIQTVLPSTQHTKQVDSKRIEPVYLLFCYEDTAFFAIGYEQTL